MWPLLPQNRIRSTLRAARVHGWVLLWALGVPVPILLLLFLLRGCQ